MSSTYNPNGTIPQATSPYAFLGILSSTNANPIVVTTVTTHGFTTGDTVVVEGHAVNTNANGRWVITVLSTTTFSLNGSTGNGVGGSTGYVNDYAINPIVTIPGDGDLANASSLNTPVEAALNMGPFMYERVGSLRTLKQNVVQSSTQVPFNATASVTPVTFTTWIDWTGLTNIFGTGSGTGNPVVQTNDTLEYHFTGTLMTVNATNGTGFPSFAARLAVTFSSGEVGNIWSAQCFSAPATVGTSNGAQNFFMMNLYAAIPILAGQNGNTYDLNIQYWIGNTGNGIAFAMGGPWQATLRHYRHN